MGGVKFSVNWLEDSEICAFCDVVPLLDLQSKMRILV
jgi:hypothetical protein